MPAAHGTHCSSDSVGADVPNGHSKHWRWPVKFWYVPWTAHALSIATIPGTKDNSFYYKALRVICQNSGWTFHPLKGNEEFLKGLKVNISGKGGRFQGSVREKRNFCENHCLSYWTIESNNHTDDSLSPVTLRHFCRATPDLHTGLLPSPPPCSLNHWFGGTKKAHQLLEPELSVPCPTHVELTEK